MFQSYLGEESWIQKLAKGEFIVGTGQPQGDVKEYPAYKGWRIWSGPYGVGRSTYSAFFAEAVPPRGGLPVRLKDGGTQIDSGSLLGIQQAVDTYLGKYPKAGPDTQPRVIGPETPNKLPAPAGETFAQAVARLEASGAIGPITGSQDINRGVPAPGYDPVISEPQPSMAKSKLPLVIIGVSLVGVIGLLWWKFRK